MVGYPSRLKDVLKTLVVILGALVALIGLSGCQAKSNELTLLAAASTKEALTEAVAAYERDHPNVRIHLSFGGSGALAEQVVQGASVDLFLSASTSAVEKVTEAKKAYAIYPMLENTLVMIQPVTSSFLLESEDQLVAAQIRKIALGETKSVPAGAYAKRILTDLDLYEILNEKYVYAKDVKEVISWVAAGEANAGFVYATDALLEPSVTVIKTYTSEETGVISYPLVVTTSKETQTLKDFVAWLRSERGVAYFTQYGFKAAKGE